MSLISYTELCKLVEQGLINADIENVNGASIDITLDDKVMFELPNQAGRTVDLMAKENINMMELEIPDCGLILSPGDFILASSREIFNLPNNIAAEYKLKSSLARNGLQHLLAGWCDPTWLNSKLTLEIKNVTKYNNLLIKKGMKIGQMIFFKCDPVPDANSYAEKGQYNNQEKVTASKGVR